MKILPLQIHELNEFKPPDGRLPSDSSGEKLRIKVKTFGGDPSFLNVLSELNLETPEVNGETYNNWASSVKDFPDVIDQKVTDFSLNSYVFPR